MVDAALPEVRIRLAEVACRFGPRTVFEGLSLSVAAGEIVALRGRNGAGKTTILNMVAAIVPPAAGAVTGLRGDDVLGYVPQNYSASLLPWLTTLDNIALPLRFHGVSAADRRRRARDVVDELQLSIPLHAYPSVLSGGERQKAAIARAVVQSPDVLLLDEPFANLDAATRFTLRETLVSHAKQDSAVLLVSHELDDCILLADRVVLLAGSPTAITAVIAVDLPHPRRESMLTSQPFLDARSQVLAEETRSQ